MAEYHDIQNVLRVFSYGKPVPKEAWEPETHKAVALLQKQWERLPENVRQLLWYQALNGAFEVVLGEQATSDFKPGQVPYAKGYYWVGEIMGDPTKQQKYTRERKILLSVPEIADNTLAHEVVHEFDWQFSMTKANSFGTISNDPAFVRLLRAEEGDDTILKQVEQKIAQGMYGPMSLYREAAAYAGQEFDPAHSALFELVWQRIDGMANRALQAIHRQYETQTGEAFTAAFRQQPYSTGAGAVR